MKRADLLLALWAIGGISLAVLFFAAAYQEGTLKSGHLGLRSGFLLLACLLWNVLLRVGPKRRN